jgi:hypothetical protein
MLGWFMYSRPAVRHEGKAGATTSGVHLFVVDDELPAPGFGQVFELWVFGADQV